ncbi:MAG: hypothetical protein NC043_06935 [Muribaculaceae bacterium]|nr:hypothetical protein [Muribaculaceae bacterium]
MENKSEKNQRGGRREGAGRKKIGIAKRYGFNAPADVAAILEALSGSKSDYIIAAIRAYHSAGQ